MIETLFDTALEVNKSDDYIRCEECLYAEHSLAQQKSEEFALLKAQLRIVTEDRNQLLKTMQSIKNTCSSVHQISS